MNRIIKNNIIKIENYINEYIQNNITADYEKGLVQTINDYGDKKYSHILELHNYNWNKISEYFFLEDEFVDIYKDFLNWNIISEEKYLSENFIEKFSDYLDWKEISYNQYLSENFIRKNKDKVYWEHITTQQNLSEEFIEEFSDYIDWDWIVLNKETFSQGFLMRNASLLD